MRTLKQTYLEHDMGLLQMISNTLGLEMAAGNRRAAAIDLAAAIQQSEQLRITCAGLSTDAREALRALLSSDGRITVAAAARRFGRVRPLGPGARLREQPAREPENSLESLWYHGLIGRAFDDKPTPQEYYYVPQELCALLPLPAENQTAHPKVEAQPPAANETVPAPHSLVDDACTALAFLRCWPVSADAEGGISATIFERLIPHLRLPAALDMLLALLQEIGLLSSPELRLNPEKTRQFLAGERAKQLRTLAQAWRDSTRWRDVLAVPGLRFDHTDTVRFEPIQTRAEILARLNTLVTENWSNLEAFVSLMRAYAPDFQRPAGDYDSWYVRTATTGEYLRGFASWERVDGALIRYLVTGPLHWLGLVDLSRVRDRFRLTSLFSALLGDTDWRIQEKQRPIAIHPDGVMLAFAAGSRADRFLAARLGEWEPDRSADVYRYRLSAESLKRASEAGISTKQMLAFLRRASGEKLPQSLRQALQRWGEKGPAAYLSEMMVLRVDSDSVLRTLRENAQTRRYLGEALGPRALQVHARYYQDLRDEMVKMGLLLQIRD